MARRNETQVETVVETKSALDIFNEFIEAGRKFDNATSNRKAAVLNKIKELEAERKSLEAFSPDLDINEALGSLDRVSQIDSQIQTLKTMLRRVERENETAAPFTAAQFETAYQPVLDEYAEKLTAAAARYSVAVEMAKDAFDAYKQELDEFEHLKTTATMIKHKWVNESVNIRDITYPYMPVSPHNLNAPITDQYGCKYDFT